MKYEITLTKVDQRRIKRHAARFGFNIEQYIRLLLAHDTLPLTKPLEKKVGAALRAHDAGKTIKTTSFSAFFS